MNDEIKQNLLLGSAVAIAIAVLGMFGLQAFEPATPSPQATAAGNSPAALECSPTLSCPASSGFLPPQSGDDKLGGLIHNIQESFDAGIAVDGTEVISGTGAITGAVSLKIGSGTSIDKHVRTTAEINVSSMTFSTVTTSAVTLTGAALGDHCSVNVTAGDYISTTSSGSVVCRVTSSDTATLYFRNTSSTGSFDAGASTFSVQAWSY